MDDPAYVLAVGGLLVLAVMLIVSVALVYQTAKADKDLDEIKDDQ